MMLEPDARLDGELMKTTLWLSIALGLLFISLSCDDDRTPEQRYCAAICSWMAECLQTFEYVDVDKCKDDCNRSFDKSSLGDVCQDEELQYLICGYEKSLDQGCSGDPALSEIPGCEDQRAALDECLVPADAG